MMSQRTLLLLGLFFLLLSIGCTGCIWSLFETPRWSYEFDIGSGQTLKVWSTREDRLRNFDFDTDPNPLMIYYRVDAGLKEVVHTTWLEHDEDGDYQFRVVHAEGGRLTCVYELARANDNPYMLILFDAHTSRSWPRNRDEDGDKIWRQRFERLKAENPDLPTPDYFFVGPPAP